MLLVKKSHFFIYLCTVKIRLEIVFNNVLDRKETVLGHKKTQYFKVPKSHFSKGVNPCFLVKKCHFSIYLLSVKIRLEKRFKNVNVLDIKETIFGHKKFTISKSQKSHFSKGVNPCFWSKKAIFFIYLFSVKIRLEKRYKIVLDTEQTICGHKKCNILKSQKSHFSIWSKNAIFLIICFRSK